MRTTDRGLIALIRHEGVVPAPYFDVKGVWTFGIGHTAAAGAPDPGRMPRGMPADLNAGIAQAFRVFRADLGRYEADVLRAVTVPPEPHEFDALVSFHYNTGGIARAALTRHLNAGDRDAAAEAFMGWLRPASLRARREAERDLFRQASYPEGPIPVWAADAAGRVDFSRPVRRLDEAEALALLRPALAASAVPALGPMPATAPRLPSTSGPAAIPAPPAPPQPDLLGRLVAILGVARVRR
jgi:lysozyme